MTINKFQGKTKEEAIEKAKQEFGENVVIMNVKEVKPKGLFGAFKSSTYEVTAAMKEKETFVNPISAMQVPKKLHENINLTADEEIKIPKPTRVEDEKEKSQEEKNLEERLSDLSSILDEKLEGTFEKQSGQNYKNKPPVQTLQEALNTDIIQEEPAPAPKTKSNEEFKFVRILYGTLIKNEVNEKYVNQLLEEIEKFLRPGNSLDTILSNVYQKLILRFGQPKTISLAGSKPKVVFFIGPTGVGKTTTIAKIASKYKVEQDKKVAFITADTYRIAATEQLRIYANILDAPMSIVYSNDELNSAVERLIDYDIIFVDTAGFSHKNDSQRQDMKNLIQGLDPIYESEVYLVLSATTKYNDLQDIVNLYKEISEYKLIFTKLDETTTYGNLLNIRLYSNADLSYVTIGQNVPDDIEIFDTQKIVKQLLGGK